MKRTPVRGVEIEPETVYVQAVRPSGDCTFGITGQRSHILRERFNPYREP